MSAETATLRQLLHDHLEQSGHWQHINAPFLEWIDLRAGDRCAVDLGTATQRQIGYEREAANNG